MENTNVIIQHWHESKGSKKSQLRDELIRKYAPLIKLVASKILRKLPPQIEINDLINAGVLGLIDAIEKFDLNRDIKFETYAEFRIRGAILDELRSLDWVPRSIRQKLHELERTMLKIETEKGRPAKDEEISKEMGISLSDYFDILNKAHSVTLISFEDLGFPAQDGGQKRNPLDYFKEPKNEDIISLLNIKEIKKAVADAITELPKNERFVISMYYFDELTMKEIGLVLAITESRVSQIHNKAILRLRGKLRKVLKDLV